MKKWLVLFLMVALVVGGWAYLRTLRYTPPWQMPEIGKVDRGDIRVPVTAAGLIEPEQRIEIKSKASGEVIEVRVREGDFVRVGDVLVQLKTDDEQRSVDRAQAALDRGKAVLNSAEVSVKRARTAIKAAETRVQELSASKTSVDFDLERVIEDVNKGRGSIREKVTLTARSETLAAQIEAAIIGVTDAEDQVAEAEANVAVQQANVREATKALEDAQERLRETTIRSRHDAIVTKMNVNPGMLVQSGTQSLTGGSAIATLADISKLKVLTRVDEADYGEIVRISPLEALPEVEGLRTAMTNGDHSARLGKVQITVDAFRDETFQGVIDRVEPQGQLNPGVAIIQFNVHVNVTDEKRHLLPLGTQAQVEFTVQAANSVLRVPTEAVKSFQDDKGVWLRTPPADGSNEQYGKKFVPCRFGISDGEFTEIIATLGGDPLEEGAAVYTKLPVERREEDED